MLDSQDDQLAKKIETYQDLAKENPNVDVSMLMLNALTNQGKNVVSPKWKKWAYLFCISLPPFGLFCALRYWMGDEDDARETAWMCIILTAVAGVIYIIGAKALFTSSGANVQQIEQITPQEIHDTLN
jgi:hypothetical protein